MKAIRGEKCVSASLPNMGTTSRGGRSNSGSVRYAHRKKSGCRFDRRLCGPQSASGLFHGPENILVGPQLLKDHSVAVRSTDCATTAPCVFT